MIHSLADKEDVDGTQVELVKPRQGSDTIVGRVHASVQLERRKSVYISSHT